MILVLFDLSFTSESSWSRNIDQKFATNLVTLVG